MKHISSALEEILDQETEIISAWGTLALGSSTPEDEEIQILTECIKTYKEKRSTVHDLQREGKFCLCLSIQSTLTSDRAQACSFRCNRLR